MSSVHLVEQLYWCPLSLRRLARRAQGNKCMQTYADLSSVLGCWVAQLLLFRLLDNFCVLPAMLYDYFRGGFAPQINARLEDG